MQILLAGRRPRLDDWEHRPIWPAVAAGPSPSDRRDAFEREVGTEAAGAPAPGEMHRRLAAAIFAFDIFPPALATGVLRKRPLEIGDAVGVCYHLAPGVDFFFASRAVARFDEARGPLWCTGFTYRTLVGHPELGEETFSVETNLATGRVLVALRSWSRPGTLEARLFSPVVRRLQVRANQAALNHLESIANPMP